VSVTASTVIFEGTIVMEEGDIRPEQHFNERRRAIRKDGENGKKGKAFK